MVQKPNLIRQDLIEPDLSYEIIGCVFDVFNQIGPGLRESTYQKGVAQALKERGIKFKEQVYYPIFYNDKRIASLYLDFLINDRVVLELKRREYFPRANIQQVNEYLKATGLTLAILANITRHGVRFKRVINVKK